MTVNDERSPGEELAEFDLHHRQLVHEIMRGPLQPMPRYVAEALATELSPLSTTESSALDGP